MAGRDARPTWIDSRAALFYNPRMRIIHLFGMIIVSAALLLAVPSIAQDEGTPGVYKITGAADLKSAADAAVSYHAYNFDCDGSLDEKRELWWLSTSNPFKFKKRFTGEWYFEELGKDDFEGRFFLVKMLLPSFSQRPDRGGRPNSAEVRVRITNPGTDETYEVKGVKVGFSREAALLPTYVYVPLDLISDDGRVIIEVSGLGTIGVSESRLVILREISD